MNWNILSCQKTRKFSKTKERPAEKLYGASVRGLSPGKDQTMRFSQRIVTTDEEKTLRVRLLALVIIPTTQEVEIRRITVRGKLWQKFWKPHPSQPIAEPGSTYL
jgi:hypothetical protein